uniref:Putative polyprotein n=1 Tax=Albugo laibachii Nc14 TaxID=890382 RepID=F0W3V7_9STRA|nr:putative polyprotein [Albugo laibachii Nc14]|eukprot:CCA15707.1 putative polyprotein [Albugo laibachii Nc14]
MTFYENDFSQLRPIQNHINISIVSGGKLEVIGIGIIHLTLTNGENIRIEDAPFVPKLDKRLLSVFAMNKKDIQSTFEKPKCEITSKMSAIVTIVLSGKSFILYGRINGKEFIRNEQIYSKATEETWHARLGHISKQIMDKTKHYVTGYRVKPGKSWTNEENPICQGCMEGKATVEPFPTTTYGKIRTAAILELVNSDVIGLMRTTTHGPKLQSWILLYTTKPLSKIKAARKKKHKKR